MRKRRLIVSAMIVALIAGIGLAARPAVKRHLQAVTCGNQMHSILFVATLLWPDEHNGRLPSDFLSMSNELATAKILVCPSDPTRKAAASWSSFNAVHCSYEIVRPELLKTDTNSVFLRCPIHGYAGFADDRLLDASGRLIRPGRLW
jgi:hypothetical protein